MRLAASLGGSSIRRVLSDTGFRILCGLALLLHLAAAPVLAWQFGQRLPLGLLHLITAGVVLLLMLIERTQLEGLPLALFVLQLLVLGTGIWQLASPDAPARIAAWIAYGLSLLWLLPFSAFAFFFRLNRLW